MPWPLLPAVPACARNVVSPVSTSVMVSVPPVLRFGLLASSVTPPVATPPITGTSLVPVMVTVTTWLVVPSRLRDGEAVGDGVAGGQFLDRRSGLLSAV